MTFPEHKHVFSLRSLSTVRGQIDIMHVDQKALEDYIVRPTLGRWSGVEEDGKGMFPEHAGLILFSNTGGKPRVKEPQILPEARQRCAGIQAAYFLNSLIMWICSSRLGKHGKYKKYH